MNRILSSLIATLALAACGLTGGDTLFLFEPTSSQMRVTTNVRSIEVMEVDLPEYANAPEILVKGVGGAVETGGSNLWADAPSRAIAAALGRNLSEITGATTATEPWPLEQFPDMRLEVRVDQMIADISGGFRLTGQYFLTPMGRDFRDRAVRFSITEPIEGEGPAAYSRAASRAVLTLSEQVATQLSN